MTDLYLMAHKVRGIPAFDIAIQMTCPECLDLAGTNYGCNECDQLGYWWIIPTSGHRAYIHTAHRLDKVFELGPGLTEKWLWEINKDINGSWTNLPDHYQVTASRHTPKRDLLAALGLDKPAAPATPFPRRI